MNGDEAQAELEPVGDAQSTRGSSTYVFESVFFTANKVKLINFQGPLTFNGAPNIGLIFKLVLPPTFSVDAAPSVGRSVPCCCCCRRRCSSYITKALLLTPPPASPRSPPPATVERVLGWMMVRGKTPTVQTDRTRSRADEEDLAEWISPIRLHCADLFHPIPPLRPHRLCRPT